MNITPEIRGYLRRVLGFLTVSKAAEPCPADAILVFGHTDPRVAQQAVELYKKGKAKLVIVSGKSRRPIPGFNTEAEYYADILKKGGVPTSAIITETEATNTLENCLFGMRAVEKADVEVQSVILCAMPPLLRRSLATFQKHFPRISTQTTGFALGVDEFSDKKYIQRLLGEFERFIEYAEKGDMERVEVPFEVQEAEQILRDWLTQ